MQRNTSLLISKVPLLSLLSVLALGLAACGSLCPGRDDLSQAAHYWASADGKYDRPVEAWARSSQVESLLKNVIQEDGRGALWSEFGMQCFPDRTSACADCEVCTASRRQAYDSFVFPTSSCDDRGEILIRAEIGPGSAVRASTYWRTKPPPMTKSPGRISATLPLPR